MDSRMHVIARGECSTAAKLIRDREIHLLDLDRHSDCQSVADAIADPSYRQQVLMDMGITSPPSEGILWVIYRGLDGSINGFDSQGIRLNDMEIDADEIFAAMLHAVVEYSRRKAAGVKNIGRMNSI
ncbi:hypothetical protein [Cohnella soli]|uniref:Uncharacterized protein n=1 Tax=Cohnella soli TaxID=425005 RepID=A0ABW0HP20_9BACL